MRALDTKPGLGRITPISLVILFILIYFSIFQEVLGQSFPLKLAANGKYFITKTQKTFLLNGCASPLFYNRSQVITNLSRYQFQGINTIFITLDSSDFVLDGAPSHRLKKNIVALKRLVREAFYKDMAVIIFPIKDLSENSPYRQLLFQKLYRFNNVLWLFHPEDSLVYKDRINPSQLKGILYDDGENFSPDWVQFTFTDSPLCDSSSHAPVILHLKAQIPVNDSVAYTLRNKAFTGILNGVSGVVLSPKENNIHQDQQLTYFPLTYQMKHWKAFFDTSKWNKLKPFPTMLTSRDMRANASINADSSMAVLYISSHFTLSLNLALFPNGATFTWINPTNGQTYVSHIFPEPVTQLFLPPFSESKYRDWLLMVKPEKTGRSQEKAHPAFKQD